MNSKFIISLVAVILILLGGGVYFLTKDSKPNPEIEKFAQCLAEKKLTMYGAYWCPHCQSQKKLFGDAFKYVPYVECTQQEKLCIEKKIDSYPTWIDNNDNRYSGELTFQKMSEITSCPLPKTN